MKISIECENDTEKYFSDVPVGDIFLVNGTVFQKTPSIGNRTKSVNCFNQNNHEYTYIYDDTVVTLLEQPNIQVKTLS